MSRCFPYPPPGYVRNPVAVAEAETTAKLQKEREKAEKKKEKRSNRKALQQVESSKHSKHSHKKRKHEDISKVMQQPKTLSKESVEQLEKSGLSEEHGAPCFVQTVLHSPESSQDSNKRRKVVLPSSSQAKNGNILRIKIKRDQDSPRGVLVKPMAFEQQSVKKMGLGSSQLINPNSIQLHNKVNVKSAAAAHERVNVEPQAIQKQDNKQLPSKFTKKDNPQMANVVQQVDPILSEEPTVGRADLRSPIVLPLAKMAQRDLPTNDVPAKGIQTDHPQVPSAEVQRSLPACPKALQEASTHAIRQLENLQPPLEHILKLEAPVVYPIQQPITSVSKEEPCSSGRNTDAVQGREVRQSKSDRKKSRKAEKKQKKFDDLFVTWNPPSFEMEEWDDGVQDWLVGSTRNSDVCMTNCRASDGSVSIQLMEQQHSLQPRATFVPSLNLYQLPYVIPF